VAIPRSLPARWRAPSESDVGCRLSFAATAVRLLSLRPIRFTHCLFDIGDDRWTQKKISELRIELGSAPFGDCLGSFSETARVTVATPMSDRVEGIGDTHNSRCQRYPLAFQAAGVAVTVPPLVVRRDTLPEVGIKGIQGRENLGATLRMRSNRASLFRSELGFVVKDVSECFVQLADVVEQRDSLDAVEHPVVELRSAPKYERVLRNAADMCAGNGVVCLNRIQERFESCRAQALGLGAPSVFMVGVGAGGRADAERKDFFHAA
jgi:hypothetical protein